MKLDWQHHKLLRHITRPWAALTKKVQTVERMDMYTRMYMCYIKMHEQ